MTLPKDVAEAVDSLNRRAPDAACQIIRAHLLIQDAEIERLREAMEPKLRELHYDANGLRATLDGGACKALAESFAEQFNSSGAVNYLDVEFTTADGTGFVVTVQKRAKPTAHELRRLAESRLAAADALLRDIKDWDVNQAQGTYLMVPLNLRKRIQAHLSENADVQP